jgi:hypothetical protein
MPAPAPLTFLLAVFSGCLISADFGRLKPFRPASATRGGNTEDAIFSP